MVFAMLGRKLLSFETHGCASGSRHFFRYFLHQVGDVIGVPGDNLYALHLPSYPFLVLYAIFWGNSLICDRIFLHFARAKLQSAPFRRYIPNINVFAYLAEIGNCCNVFGKRISEHKILCKLQINIC